MSYRLGSGRIRSNVTEAWADWRGLPAVSTLGLVLALGCSDAAGDGGAGGAAQGGSGSSTAGAAGTASSTGGAGAPPTGMAGMGALSGAAGATAGAPTGGQGGQAMAGSANGGSSGMGGAGGGSAGGGGAGGSGGAPSGDVMRSAGCKKPRALNDGAHMFQSGGSQRSYRLRAPTNYDNDHPYRLILGFHGATGKSSDIAPSFFGLWDLSQGSTIFAAPDAVGGIWNADTDTTMVKDLVKQITDELCIDTSRIELEGFSQGGAMTWTLACALPGTFRAAVVHSGGGLAMPKTCQPIPFISSLGHDGSGQGMSSDFFAMTNGCKVESLPTAPTGGHACTDYKGCSAGHPTRWCAYDGGHTPSPQDAGQSMSWMPQEVWTFLKQF